jgi:DNA-binding transcriptional LysR family regulator
MIEKLEMFIAVAREEHFGRAAASLGITQPSLSSGIKQLEDQLGVQLIFRGSRFGGLTPEGKTALDWARRIVGDARQLKAEMRQTRHGLSGQLRMAVIPTALTWASHLATRFSAKHPKVRFKIQSRSSVEILNMLENLEIDVGLSYLDNEPLGRVSTASLYQENYMLICSQGSAFADRSSVEWAELGDQKLCLLTSDMQNRRIIDRNFADHDIELAPVIEANSTVVLVSNVLRGDWLTILPEDLANFLIVGKPLVSIPIKGGRDGHHVGLVAPYNEPHTPTLAALLAEAKRMS